MSLSSFLQNSSRRTTFLSEGIKLCAIITVVCAAPLPFVELWIAIWLLVILSAVALGTFGVWAYNAVKNQHLFPSEEHREQMAAVSLLGRNRDDQPPLLTPVELTDLGQNPESPTSSQESDDA
ncbi:hypothetical protein [Aurantiacibacter sediminis]|uniref:Uncharacterized protein n=1 Tax=Aurantiacibacter sediminis TaxID=2793064 RepID=A0ABS0N4A7_9SPHN|nr:hypothetical protein [Aurantiacibacter sediminis]MBH5322557.1 hypothetical protein [Aurantiacibacter sediminis]